MQKKLSVLSMKHNNYQSHSISSCSVKLKILVCFNEVIMTPDLKAKNTTLTIIAIAVLLHFIFYIKKCELAALAEYTIKSNVY